MQSKINTFFKPSSTPKLNHPTLLFDHIDDIAFTEKKKQTKSEILVTYKRRTSSANPHSNDEIGDTQTEETPGDSNSIDFPAKPASFSGRTLKKKRTYVQFHLELGQSDFLLHTCSICGLKYACGNEGDEKVHKDFHKDYTQGIKFRGWCNERVIPVPSSDGALIILVLDSDSPAQRNKVQEVVKMMEMDLGLKDDWIIHKLCKVYLFVSSQRIAGCLVTEPIKNAYRVIASSVAPRSSEGTKTKETRSNSTVLRFGNVEFQREVIKRVPFVNSSKVYERDFNGAIFHEKEAVPALCGIRGIWVTPSNRRKYVATQLLDAARKSFCKGFILERSQLAFSQPTCTGKALASSYTGKESFWIYKNGTWNC